MIQYIFLVFCLVFATPFVTAQDTKIQQSMDKGIAFLRSTQSDTGGWSASPRTGIGPTAVILAGLLDAGVNVDDPMIVSGLKLLKASVRPDGGVYTPDGFIQNYETCVVMMCFAKANEAAKKKDGSEPYKELLTNAEKYIRGQQFTEGRNTRPEDPHYGGIGYGGTARPDLSHTQFFLDALKATGAKEDDPAIQRALVFVSRCQNWESEYNTMPYIARNAENLDGGFIYVNQPPEDDSTGLSLKSYGGMTYAGLKSMIYAGLTKEDKRVKAALEWIAKNYTVTENPGRGAVGLYYYYQTMTKALDVHGLPYLEDIDGKRHNWRSDLSEHLISVQRENGSWVNAVSRQYMEGDANFVTGFVLLALALCLPQE